MLRYYFNFVVQQFEGLQTQLSTYSSHLWYSSVSESKEWLIAATETGTYIYSQIEDNITLIETLSGSEKCYIISDDGTYIIVGKSG